MGLCTPRPHILSFYEERMQRRIKEEVSSLKSPQGEVSPQSLRDVPPRLSQNFQQERGERDRLRLLRGHSPQGISKGKPLRYAFADFSRKRKVSASVGGMSPQNKKAFRN